MKQFIFFCLLLIYQTSQLNAQNVGINATGLAPHSSAMLDILSTDKGLLIPRVALADITLASPITSPTVSLIVYNTSTSALATASNNVLPGFYYWDGSKWVAFSGSGGREWALLGNAGTVAGTNFIGTTDAIDWVIKTNNTERMRVLSGGNVGIGITTPTTALHVVETSALQAVQIDESNAGNALLINESGAGSAIFAVETGAGNGLAVTSNDDGAGLTVTQQGVVTVSNTAAYIENSSSTATNSLMRKGLDVVSKSSWAVGTATNVGLAVDVTGAGSPSNFAATFIGGSVGIGTSTPTQSLDVVGNVKFSNALMPNNLPGTTGQVLVSQGANTAPVWRATASILKVYSAFATRTRIPATGSGIGWTDVTGLNQTVTTTGPAILIISTYGSLEIISSSNYSCGAELQILQNGSAIPNAYQTHDWNDGPSSTGTINHWSFQTVVTIASAGTYTFKVQAHKYLPISDFDNFYAGGNTTAPTASQNQGALIIQQFDQ